VIPDVPGYQIDRRRLALAGGAAQRTQHAPERAVAPLEQHLYRVHDRPRRTWTPQLKPALGPIGQALVEVENGRVRAAFVADGMMADVNVHWAVREDGQPKPYVGRKAHPRKTAREEGLFR